jgi:hypothetical protein
MINRNPVHPVHPVRKLILGVNMVNLKAKPFYLSGRRTLVKPPWQALTLGGKNRQLFCLIIRSSEQDYLITSPTKLNERVDAPPCPPVRRLL